MGTRSQNEDVVRLLWTGGWDSTFRMLDLILIKQKPVQPYYLIDAQRRSLGTEILAMNTIKRRLDIKHPDLSHRLRPTVFRDVHDIPPNHEIHESYQRICAQNHIGIQYEWGARFAQTEGLSKLELSLIGAGHMFQFFGPYLYRQDVEDDVVCEIDRKHHGTDIYRVFKDYRFPLIFMTKQEMHTKAKQHGFEEFMLLTCFCHTPRSDGRPCGVCIPCGIVIECGLGWRLPRTSRVRFHLKRLYRRGRGVLEKHPRAFPVAQRLAQKLKRTKTRQIPLP